MPTTKIFKTNDGWLFEISVTEEGIIKTHEIGRGDQEQGYKSYTDEHYQMLRDEILKLDGYQAYGWHAISAKDLQVYEGRSLAALYRSAEKNGGTVLPKPEDMGATPSADEINTKFKAWSRDGFSCSQDPKSAVANAGIIDAVEDGVFFEVFVDFNKLRKVYRLDPSSATLDGTLATVIENQLRVQYEASVSDSFSILTGQAQYRGTPLLETILMNSNPSALEECVKLVPMPQDSIKRTMEESEETQVYIAALDSGRKAVEVLKEIVGPDLTKQYFTESMEITINAERGVTSSILLQEHEYIESVIPGIVIKIAKNDPNRQHILDHINAELLGIKVESAFGQAFEVIGELSPTKKSQEALHFEENTGKKANIIIAALEGNQNFAVHAASGESGIIETSTQTVVEINYSKYALSSDMCTPQRTASLGYELVRSLYYLNPLPGLGAAIQNKHGIEEGAVVREATLDFLASGLSYLHHDRLSAAGLYKAKAGKIPITLSESNGAITGQVTGTIQDLLQEGVNIADIVDSGFTICDPRGGTLKYSDLWLDLEKSAAIQLLSEAKLSRDVIYDVEQQLNSFKNFLEKHVITSQEITASYVERIHGIQYDVKNVQRFEALRELNTESFQRVSDFFWNSILTPEQGREIGRFRTTMQEYSKRAAAKGVTLENSAEWGDKLEEEADDLLDAGDTERFQDFLQYVDEINECRASLIYHQSPLEEAHSYSAEILHAITPELFGEGTLEKELQSRYDEISNLLHDTVQEHAGDAQYEAVVKRYTATAQEALDILARNAQANEIEPLYKNMSNDIDAKKVSRAGEYYYQAKGKKISPESVVDVTKWLLQSQHGEKDAAALKAQIDRTLDPNMLQKVTQALKELVITEKPTVTSTSLHEATQMDDATITRQYKQRLDIVSELRSKGASSVEMLRKINQQIVLKSQENGDQYTLDPASLEVSSDGIHFSYSLIPPCGATRAMTRSACEPIKFEEKFEEKPESTEIEIKPATGQEGGGFMANMNQVIGVYMMLRGFIDLAEHGGEMDPEQLATSIVQTIIGLF